MFCLLLVLSCNELFFFDQIHLGLDSVVLAGEDGLLKGGQHSLVDEVLLVVNFVFLHGQNLQTLNL